MPKANLLHLKMTVKQHLILVFSSGFLALAALLSSPPAMAQAPILGQDVQRIAAVVNDEIISDYDLDQRLGLVISTLGVEDGQQIRQRLLPQVLRAMVDEKLEVQEAREFEVEIDNEEIEENFYNVSRQNNMRPQQFVDYLSGFGVTPVTLMSQIRAELAWSKLVGGLLNPRVSIAESEIDNIVSRLRASKGETEYLISEIVLIVDNPNEREEAREQGLRLLGHIKDGASFQVVARQFSQGSTSAIGGDVGWVQSGQVPEPVEAALRAMKVGEISNPIRSAGGYYIVSLRDRRTILGPDPLRMELDLKRIFVTIEDENDEAQVSAASDDAERIRRRIRGCGSLEGAATGFKNAKVVEVGTVTLGDLPPALRPSVQDLPLDMPTRVFQGQGGLAMLVVCGRTEPPTNEPNREMLADGLRRQRVSMMARRYLRDLRRDAIVDVR